MKRTDYINWDEYFMGIALLTAMRSKDPSSQVGACIVSPENKILSLGYNGMPIGCDDDAMPWDREGEPLDTKYMYVCQLPVRGNDEIAELTAGFNVMARQLEIMRHESIKSARQERSRMLGEIALGFAHEIRNPLVVIKTSAEVVLASLAVKSREVRLLGFVVEEVARINNLISEFLAFAKPSPLKLEYFPLSPLIQEIAELSSAEMDKRGIRYSFSNEAEDDRVLGERSQIRQVLLNLGLNAMDAMPQGGTLSVRLYAEGGQIRIELKDTGCGIPPNLLSTIHMPFISTKKNGLGLGLSKAYAIIEEHGGSISCSSTVGEGTVFTVCLNR